MRKCPHCNKDLGQHLRFCPHCMTVLIEKEVIASTDHSSKTNSFPFLKISAGIVLLLSVCILFFSILASQEKSDTHTHAFPQETVLDAESKKETATKENEEPLSPPTVPQTQPETVPSSSPKNDDEMQTETPPSGGTSIGSLQNPEVIDVSFSISNVSFPVEFDNSPSTAKDFSWDIKDGVLTICGNGAMPVSRQMPWESQKDSIQKIVVMEGITSIAGSSFRSLPALSFVSLPKSLTTIEGFAFAECPNLKTCNFPSSLRSIGRSAFRDTNLSKITLSNIIHIHSDSFINTPWYESQKEGALYLGNLLCGYKGTPPSNLNVRDGTLLIATCAFNECTSLTRLTLPDSVIYIGTNAFSNCENLSSVSFGSGIKEIANSAFSGCKNLTELNFPDSLIAVGRTAFQSCYNVEKVSLSKNLTHVGELAFQGIDKPTQVELPQKLVRFDGTLCFGMSEIVIPDCITVIEDASFGCNATIKKIVLGKGIKSIEFQAFNNCNGLTEIVIPEKCETIDYGAFMLCKNLKTVHLPKSLVSLGSYVFYGCSSLQTITYAGTKEDWKKVDVHDSNNQILNDVQWKYSTTIS